MKPQGVEWNRWVDPIDDFVRQHGRHTPRWAVFLTYNLDLSRFGRVVLPVLSRHGKRFRVVVISDQAALENNLQLSRPQLPGPVNLHPIRCRRAP